MKPGRGRRRALLVPNVSRRLRLIGASTAAVALALAMAFTSAGCGKTGEFQNGRPDTSNLSPATDFQFTVYESGGVLRGSQAKLSDLKGKPVVLNFWAGLCPPCRAEMPDLEEVHKEFKGKLVLLGIDVGPFTGLGSREDAKALLRQLNVTYPTGGALDGKPLVDYGVVGMPTTVFITADMKVYRKWTGLLTKQKMTSLVEELLAASGAS